MGNRQPKSMADDKKAYFSFMKEYRRKHCDMLPSQMYLHAAKEWRNLSEEERKNYADQTSEIETAKPKLKVARRPACRVKKKPACKRKPLKKTKRACKKPKPKKKLCKPRMPRVPRVPRKPAYKPTVPKKPARGIRQCKPRQPKKLSCPKRKRGFFGISSGAKTDIGEDEAKKKAEEVAKQCMKPGPVMSNGFLNFMREFRTKNCGLDPKTTLKRGARAWCRLPKDEKDKYRKLGCTVTQSKTRKSSKLCRQP